MKKFIALIIALCMAISICGAFADAERYFEAENAYRSRWTGIVMCTNITVRMSPSTSAQKYGQLHNGDVVRIVEQLDGWYAIDLKTSGLKDAPDGVGYIKSSLVKSNPYWIVTTQYTPVYSDPWGTGNSNGEISVNTPMMVVSENNYYYCVQTRPQSAGSSFIRKYDVGRFSAECEPGYAVVVDGPIYAYSYFDPGYQLGKLESFEVVQVVEWGEWNTHIFYTKKDGTYYDAYVPSMNLQPVIN